VVNAILLRPLPFPMADHLVSIFNTYPKAGVPDDGSSVTNYYERRGHIAAFSSLALYRDDAAIVGETGATEREYVMRVTPEFFTTLGVGPALGRAFTEEETTFQTSHVVIVTDTYWREHLAADPQVIGRALRVDGERFTVVGVLPPGFSFLSSKRSLLPPLATDPRERDPERRHSGNSSHMIARLRPGVSPEEAQSQIDAHNAAMELTDPQAQFIADAGFRSIVVPLHAAEVAEVRPTLLILQAGVFLLLLVGAVNVTNLLLIRASGRMKELAVRQAIGASRRHVVAEVLIETTLLTSIGSLLGLAVGAGGVRLLTLLGANRLPLGAHIALDWRAAAVAGGERPRDWRRHRPACCLVQPAEPRDQLADVRNAHHDRQPRGAAPAPRLPDRTGGARLRAAGRRWPAGVEPEASDGRRARLPALKAS
jgi:hypothetical protein